MKGGRRYPLLIYTLMMDRWRPWILWIGLGVIGLAGILYFENKPISQTVTLGSVGIFLVFASVLMWLVRNGAYVQPFPQYLRLATPFLKLNISYKRFRRASSASMSILFPPARVTKAQREVVAQVAGKTAIYVELLKFPISQTTLRFFLSPLFFKDKTPHLILLVEDWMGLSTELDSMRSGGGAAESVPQKPRSNSILSKLSDQK